VKNQETARLSSTVERVLAGLVLSNAAKEHVACASYDPVYDA
jgi:hypothetical protein